MLTCPRGLSGLGRIASSAICSTLLVNSCVSIGSSYSPLDEAVTPFPPSSFAALLRKLKPTSGHASKDDNGLGSTSHNAPTNPSLVRNGLRVFMHAYVAADFACRDTRYQLWQVRSDDPAKCIADYQHAATVGFENGLPLRKTTTHKLQKRVLVRRNDSVQRTPVGNA